MINTEERDSFISEYAQLILNKDYLDLIEKLKLKSQTIRKSVLNKYTSIEKWHFVENQIYNEKNVAVEVLSVMLEAKEEFEKIWLPWTKYIIKELESRIKEHQNMIESSIWWLSSWLTMSVYTETDIMLRWANAIDTIVEYNDKEMENLKTPAKDDSTTAEVNEDNS